MLKELLNPWVIFGLVAQFIFFLRFFVQWLASEKQGEVVVPRVFWYLSIIGGTMLTIYAMYRQDLVFTFGQGLGLIMYMRNLSLSFKPRNNKLSPSVGN